MKQLTEKQVEAVSGGLGPLAVVGAIWLAVEVADAIYCAGKAFAEGYESNDKV